MSSRRSRNVGRTQSPTAKRAQGALRSGRLAGVRERSSSGGLPYPPVECEGLDADARGGPGRQLNDVAIVERTPYCRLGEAPDVHVGLHGVHALPHHQLLVDGRAEPPDTPFEVGLEAAEVRPLFGLFPIDDSDTAEVARELS
jgi:hypothetical protein